MARPDTYFEIDIIDRFRDRQGRGFDCVVEWVDDTLPGGATDPSGFEFHVAVNKKMKGEDLRDQIRTIAQGWLNSAPFNFPSDYLEKHHIEVDGYVNEGKDGPDGPREPGSIGLPPRNFVWYHGPAKVFDIPGKQNVYKEIATFSRPCPNLPTSDISTRSNWAFATIWFNQNIKPRTEGKIKYWFTIKDSSGAIMHTMPVDTPVAGPGFFKLESGPIDIRQSAIGDVYNQDMVYMTLTMSRIVPSSNKIKPEQAGKIVRAELDTKR